MNKDKKYWLDLRDRYFEAETTEEEERELRRFAAQSQDSDFRELQAVMGFTAMGRAVSPSHQSHSMIGQPHSTIRRTLSIAASIILILGLSLYMTLHSEQEDSACVAWVNGEEITDPSQVMAMMQNTMLEMNLSGSNPVETQLGDMFRCSMTAE